jgi:membrane protease subunit (stomatin/prohibitin family)
MTNNDGNTEIITNMEEAVRQGKISKDDYLITKLNLNTAQTTEPGQSIIEKYKNKTIILQTAESVEQDRSSVAFRIETCKNCDRLNSLKFCRECGCFMPAKVRIKSVACPIGKWDKAT